MVVRVVWIVRVVNVLNLCHGKLPWVVQAWQSQPPAQR